MAAAITSTMPGNGSIDVRIDGSLAPALGVVAAQIASHRLHVVRALSPTDQIPQTASP